MKRHLVALIVGVLIGVTFAATQMAEAYYPAAQNQGNVHSNTLISDEVTCATTATQLPSNSALVFALRVPDAGATVFIGDSGVTTANGFPLYAKDSVTYSLQNTNRLYCIVAASTQVLKITGAGK